MYIRVYSGTIVSVRGESYILAYLPSVTTAATPGLGFLAFTFSWLVPHAPFSIRMSSMAMSEYGPIPVVASIRNCQIKSPINIVNNIELI